MSSLLENLENELLPKPIQEAFVEWCVWEQARPALAAVLEKVKLHPLIQELNAAQNLDGLLRWIQGVPHTIDRLQRMSTPLGISAAKAAFFEFGNLAKAAQKSEWDPGGAAFFSARVCGWAGWAAGDFSQPAQKNDAEQNARQEQEIYLERLLQQSNNYDT